MFYRIPSFCICFLHCIGLICSVSVLFCFFLLLLCLVLYIYHLFYIFFINIFVLCLIMTHVPPSLVGERRAYPAPPGREAWVRTPPTPTHKTCRLSAVGDLKWSLVPLDTWGEPLLINLDCWCMGLGLFLPMISMYDNKLFILLYWIPMNQNILFIFFYNTDESE